MTKRIPTLALLTLAILLCLAAVGKGAFPGKNGRIVFDSAGARGEDAPPSVSFAAVEDIRPGGGGRRRLLFCREIEFGPREGRDCSLGEFGQPSYSPDGRRIVFATNSAIGVMNADGGGVRIYRTSGDPSDPAFSPDGKRVVFTNYLQVRGRPRYDLHVLQLRTKRMRLLARQGEEPVWSARNRIAFRRRGRNIYSIRPEGKGLMPITRKEGAEPEWSPSGREIAFARNGHIYIARPGTPHVRRLRGTASDARHPAWSPDGRLIAYEADVNGGGSLHVIGANGRGNRLLLRGNDRRRPSSLDYSSPRWQPVR